MKVTEIQLSFSTVVQRPPLAPSASHSKLFVDLRSCSQFERGHLPGSIFAGLEAPECIGPDAGEMPSGWVTHIALQVFQFLLPSSCGDSPRDMRIPESQNETSAGDVSVAALNLIRLQAVLSQIVLVICPTTYPTEDTRTEVYLRFLRQLAAELQIPLTATTSSDVDDRPRRADSDENDGATLQSPGSVHVEDIEISSVLLYHNSPLIPSSDETLPPIHTAMAPPLSAVSKVDAETLLRHSSAAAGVVDGGGDDGHQTSVPSPGSKVVLVDVRLPDPSSDLLPSAIAVPLNADRSAYYDFAQSVINESPYTSYCVFCRAGYTSLTFISIVKRILVVEFAQGTTDGSVSTTSSDALLCNAPGMIVLKGHPLFPRLQGPTVCSQVE